MNVDPLGNVKLEQEFKIEYLRPGKHLQLLPIPEAVLKRIGLVIAYWGHFELHFDVVLEAILIGLQREAVGWKNLSFTRRKELMKTVAQELLKGKNDPALSAMLAVCGDAAGLHPMRNVVAHGRYSIGVVAPGDLVATVFATGNRKGKAVTVKMDEATLDKLWHDLSHLGGSLVEAARLFLDVGGNTMTFPDTDVLRDVQAKSRRPPPTLGKT